MSILKVSSEQAGKSLKTIVKDSGEAVRKETVRRAKGGGDLIRNQTLEVLRGQRHGRRYGRHQASAPGEPPAQLSGTLRNSFKPRNIVVRNGDKTTVFSRAISNLATSGKNPDFNYAWIDEGYGKVAPRPYVEKVVDKAYDLLLKSLKRPYHV